MEWLRQLFARGLVENTVKIFFIVCILITMQNSKRKRKRKRNLSELHDYRQK
jgi:RsiW-degrading membrane proteinase PrsW (M82 family)